MKEIKIQLDYSNGPLWKDSLNVKTGELTTGISVIDNDKAIQILNDEAEKMYESLYSFNSENNGFQFNNDKFHQIKSQLLSIVQTIINRLSAINDGSFTVIDKATKMLQ